MFDERFRIHLSTFKEKERREAAINLKNVGVDSSNLHLRESSQSLVEMHYLFKLMCLLEQK